ncbi:MAG TPA: response regulator transcription factor, partial [Pseudonocardia sp.]|nr:response regulator transcription factor [Pseudonocardia sp.]
MTLRIVIADDSLIVRAGLRNLLTEEGMDVVDAVADADALMAAVALTHPDVAVVDIRMPPTHTDEGVLAVSRIRSQYPRTAALLLSQYVEAPYVMELLAGGRTHVGYLLKDRVLEPEALVAAVRRVHSGEVVVDPGLVESLLTAPQLPPALQVLSTREREVLALMAEDLTDRGIATRLTISVRTVHTHVQRVLDRLGIADTPHDNRR